MEEWGGEQGRALSFHSLGPSFGLPKGLGPSFLFH